MPCHPENIVLPAFIKKCSRQSYKYCIPWNFHKMLFNAFIKSLCFLPTWKKNFVPCRPKSTVFTVFFAIFFLLQCEYTCNIYLPWPTKAKKAINRTKFVMCRQLHLWDRSSLGLEAWLKGLKNDFKLFHSRKPLGKKRLHFVIVHNPSFLKMSKSSSKDLELAWTIGFGKCQK